MKDSYICYDCQRVTSGDCGQHGPRVLVTYPGAPKPEPAPAESRADRLRDALAAARDVLVAEQKEMGWLPQQQAWSTKMNAAELRIAEAVRSIDAILADDEPEPVPASVGGPLLDLESFEDRAYQRGLEAGRAEIKEQAIRDAATDSQIMAAIQYLKENPWDTITLHYDAGEWGISLHEDAVRTVEIEPGEGLLDRLNAAMNETRRLTPEPPSPTEEE